jgi:aspartyl-tRNA(Asn)/glutamyl-tRNA(Gln) amidotransferase subunit B
MWETGSRPEALVEAKGLRQVSDGAEILRIIDGVLAKEPEKVAEYKEGKEKLFGYFVGLVMKEMKGRGNPSVVNELLKNALKD